MTSRSPEPGRSRARRGSASLARADGSSPARGPSPPRPPVGGVWKAGCGLQPRPGSLAPVSGRRRSGGPRRSAHPRLALPACVSRECLPAGGGGGVRGWEGAPSAPLSAPERVSLGPRRCLGSAQAVPQVPEAERWRRSRFPARRLGSPLRWSRSLGASRR